MVYFSQTEINLGDTPLKTVHNLSYEFVGDPAEIQNVTASCGCTANVTKESNKITAKFTVTNEGSFEKKINVFFVNKSRIPLTIKGNGI